MTRVAAICSLAQKGWFAEPGAYVLVDGQFGSTGKGLLAGFLANVGAGRITHVTTNAGPNSGHTAFDDEGNEIMTQQIPVASVFLEDMGHPVTTYLNAGAIIDEGIFDAEMERYELRDAAREQRMLIHPIAALITDEDREADKAIVGKIAGTGKGIGPAMARKLLRSGRGLSRDVYAPFLPVGDRTWDNFWDWRNDVVFVETAQGFSLGVNSARFHPHTTSRECTVGQALSDARIPAQMLRKSVATFRTFPIRVGNTDTGRSGDGYDDQVETSWEALGLTPEMTTVTKRVRRVFTWSRRQFKDCIAANRPEVIFLNFCNYLDTEGLGALVRDILIDYIDVMGTSPEEVLLGFGPRTDDITTLEAWGTATRPAALL